MIETDTPTAEREVLDAAIKALAPEHEHMGVVFEHGQWWALCMVCGATWAAVDTNEGVEFEEVSGGDDFCRDNGLRKGKGNQWKS